MLLSRRSATIVHCDKRYKEGVRDEIRPDLNQGPPGRIWRTATLRNGSARTPEKADKRKVGTTSGAIGAIDPSAGSYLLQ